MKSVKRNVATVIMLCFALVLAMPMQLQAASKVKISKSKMTIVVGQKKTLTVKNTKKKVTWTSSEKSVAKVDRKGVVTAKKAGVATITAKVGKKKYTCTVTVKEKPTLSNCETICVGQKLKLKVEGTAQKVKWSSSDKKTVKVDKKGNVRGLKKGTAIITAKVGNKTLKCKVKVKDAVYKIKETVRIKDAGFVAIAHLSEEISCEISNPAIATIALTEAELAEEGPGLESILVLYAKKSGTAYITVTNNCNNKKMKFKVIVQKTTPTTAKDKLSRYMIDCAELDSDCNKTFSKSYKENAAQAKIVYNFWDGLLGYEYTEVIDGTKVEWSVLGADDPSTGSYIVMWITPKGEKESQYVTAEVDLAAYSGEKLTYEEAWYKIAAADELQRIANEVTPRAYQAMDDLLKPVGVTIREVFDSEY